MFSLTQSIIGDVHACFSFLLYGSNFGNNLSSFVTTYFCYLWFNWGFSSVIWWESISSIIFREIGFTSPQEISILSLNTSRSVKRIKINRARQTQLDKMHRPQEPLRLDFGIFGEFHLNIFFSFYSVYHKYCTCIDL